MSPCQGCHSGCCRSFAVPITGADILRIEAERGLSFHEFGCRWEDREGLISQGAAPHFHFADEPETPFVICLRQEVSTTFRNTTKCTFLVESPPSSEHPLGTAQCGNYGSRPQVCRVYPTRLSESGMVAEIHSVPPHGRQNSTHPIYNLCSEPWQPSDLDPLRAVQDLVLFHFETNFFSQVAEVWNKALAPFEVFPEFLRAVYRGRVVLETPRGIEATIPLGLHQPLNSRSRRAA